MGHQALQPTTHGGTSPIWQPPPHSLSAPLFPVKSTLSWTGAPGMPVLSYGLRSLSLLARALHREDLAF